MGSQYLGEIRMVAFNFPPKGWAQCDGQTMQISQNQALFALLGTTFGGNGQTTFLLPDLRGRVPLSWGSQQGSPSFTWGQNGGEELHTLTQAEMPAHGHTPMASSAGPTVTGPSGNSWASNIAQYATSPINTAMATNAISNNAGGQGHENRAPYQVVNFIIALAGIFPPRN
ncbi:MAG TPA: tail fiber protein [Candidatus Sulfotelmatobacter sp.]